MSSSIIFILRQYFVIFCCVLRYGQEDNSILLKSNSNFASVAHLTRNTGQVPLCSSDHPLQLQNVKHLGLLSSLGKRTGTNRDRTGERLIFLLLIALNC